MEFELLLNEYIDIVHLRDFKIHLAPQGEVMNTLRFYLEFAPYGDLSSLVDRYRAFHRYLPEKFLWHVFNSLAHAVDAMHRTRDNRVGVNKDIKLLNIFLGYEDVRADANGGGLRQDSPYPCIKLGDFGLAEFVATDPGADSGHLQWPGTDAYAAPVSHTSFHGMSSF